MAYQHFSYQKLQALQSGVNTAAQAWQRTRDLVAGSEVTKAQNSPDYFEGKADAMYADALQPLALENRKALDLAKSSRIASGIAGGIGEKQLAGIAGGFQGQAAGLRAGADEWAATARTQNEQAFFDLQQRLAETQAGVISAQQRLAERLGQQAAYDSQYKQGRWYAPTSGAAQEFFSSVGWDSRTPVQQDRARAQAIAKELQAADGIGDYLKILKKYGD